MKKYRIIIGALFCCLIMACSKNNEVASEIEPVQHLQATPFIGSVILSWTNSISSDYYYTLISYKDTLGNVINTKVGCYDTINGTTSATLSGFNDTREHEFILTTHGYSGAISSEMKITSTPEGINVAKDYVIGTVTTKPATEGALISWENISGVAVNLIATYINNLGVSTTVTISAQKTGSAVISGMSKTTVISVYAQNVKDGEKSESKSFTVTPIVDPDDVIYDDVNYFTFSGSMWDMGYSQDNAANQYQYSVTTTGTDPYVFLNPLGNSKVGTVLKFRYKSTRSINFEIYWCDVMYGASGGRSTVVTLPAASSWTTFTHDYGSDMIKMSWIGNPGNTMRFDFGDYSGVVINIRNIHFEK